MKLKSDATEALLAGPFSVVHKSVVPPSGDQHDYMSYAPYWWPDPAKPDGLPYIRRDGERNPSRLEISDKAELNDMASTVETLTLAYFFTGEKQFAERSADLLRQWFIDCPTRMNPNLKYAQAVRGRSTGRSTGLIDGRSFVTVVDSVGLLVDSDSWTADDERALQAWFVQFLQWLQHTGGDGEVAAGKNNHGTFCDLQVAMYALYVGKPDVARRVIESVRTTRIAPQIEPDGRQPLELARTKAWSYSVANLSGLMQLATLGDRLGIDLWEYQTEDGRSIRAGLNFLAPYGVGETKWPYEQLGGFEPKIMHPLLRRAAQKYPAEAFQVLLTKLQPLDPSDRANLIQSGSGQQ
jgi:hypothetical protein